MRNLLLTFSGNCWSETFGKEGVILQILFFCQEGKLRNKWSFFLDFLPQPRVIFIGFTCAPLILTFIHLSSCIFPSLWTRSKSVHFFMRGKTWIPYFSGLIPHPFHCPPAGYAQSYFLRTICYPIECLHLAWLGVCNGQPRITKKVTRLSFDNQPSAENMIATSYRNLSL